jgi:heterodisulfide reductase subunit A-like polyferredoxin
MVLVLRLRAFHETVHSKDEIKVFCDFPQSLRGFVGGGICQNSPMNNSKQTSFDVIVIGAGVAGLSTAMQLAKRGQSVVVSYWAWAPCCTTRVLLAAYTG